MKVKVKGLVFVGFAAAILSANAMAVDNTVTSKEYVDTKFQTKANITTTIDATSPSDTKYPSESAITAYVATAGGQFQTKSQAADENKVANGNGGWKALNSDIATATDNGNGATTAAIKTYVGTEISDALQNGVAGDGYVTATYDSTNNDTTVALDATKITSSSTLVDNSTKLAREGDVKGYVDGQLSDALQNGVAGDGYVTATYDSTNNDTTVALDATKITSSSTLVDNSTKLAREGDVKGYVDGQLSDALQNGVAGDGYVTATYDSTNNDTTVALDATKITSSSTLVDNSTKLAREGDVKGYVDTQDALKVNVAQGAGNANKTLITDANGNVTVSSQATSVVPALPVECTTGTPCALVTNETTNAIEWVPIAQSTDSVGA